MAKTDRKPPPQTPTANGRAMRPVSKKQSGIAALLAIRGATHGDFTDHAAITQQIKQALAAGPGFERMNAVQLEAAEMIAHKLGRIAAGNPSHIDHWADIAGYAQLVVERLPATSEV